MDNRVFAVSKSGNETIFTTWARGFQILATPLLNKGTAFSLEEREALGLTGLLPSKVSTLEEQAKRSYQQYSSRATDLDKNIFLTALHDRNEVLFYKLLSEHLSEMLPIIYDPTVGVAIERYSNEYRRPRGLYLSIDHPEQIEAAFLNLNLGPDDIDLIVATDAEEILGIGDWGVGGIDITIGKLAVYTAAAGIDPTRVIPVVLDVGTNRETLLNDPSYVGHRHSRATGEKYDAFIEAYVKTVQKLFPQALLHWEDFGPGNGRRILEKYRNRVCTFNDDMQGTGAITLAALLSSIKRAGTSMRDQRVVIFGSGTAGVGIADQIQAAMVRAGLSQDEATCCFWCVDKNGLLTDDMGNALRDYQTGYARPAAEVKEWARSGNHNGIALAEVVHQVKPTILVGTSTCSGAFSESMIREMAEHTDHPIIFPLSNPTHLAEATPSDLIHWTDGRALVSTGSPFNPVTYNGVTHVIGQANNAMLYPGLGLGTIVSRAKLISDGMFVAAAEAVAGMVNGNAPGAALLPHVENLRAVSATVAVAVANQAKQEGLAQVELNDTIQQVQDAMWQPVYPTITAATEATRPTWNQFVSNSKA